MKVNSIGSTNSAVQSVYGSMYQGSMSQSSIKMNRGLFPSNKAQGSKLYGEGALQYIKNIKSASKSLSGALKDVSGAAFNKRAATSSDTDTMTVKYTGNRPSSIKQTSVKIDQTAAGQSNESASLKTDAAYEGAAGTNKFSINTNGKTTEFSVNVEAGDTNGTVAKKMADAINKSGIGVKATVETDSNSKESVLKIEANSTGDNKKSKFTISDTTGNLVEKTGVGEVASEARNAQYSVNGGSQRTSQTNTVDIGKSLSVTFKKASDEAVTIGQGKDLEYAKSAVEDMVKSYNDLYAEAAQKTNDPKAQNLATKMVNISKTYSGSLSNVGIGFDNDGRMTIDSKKMDEAAESGKLEDFFTQNSGKNYGFTNQLSRLSNNVTQHTSNYVSSSEIGSALTENFAYTNMKELLQYNYLNTGLLFDFKF